MFFRMFVRHTICLVFRVKSLEIRIIRYAKGINNALYKKPRKYTKKCTIHKAQFTIILCIDFANHATTHLMAFSNRLVATSTPNQLLVRLAYNCV